MKNQIICATVVLIACLTMPAMAVWTTPQLVGGAINTSAHETSPFLSSDGLTLYFNRTSGHAGIYQATRSSTSDPFTSVTELTALASGSYSAKVTADNLRMYYAGPGWVLKMSQRNSVTDNWAMGTAISELNAGHLNATPSVTSDELTIVFIDGDPTGDSSGANIYIATRPDTASPFDNITALTSVNSNYAETDPFITSDGLGLYFTSMRDGISQLYYTSRNSLLDSFSTPQALSFINKPNLPMGGASLSSDGQALYFNMLTPGGQDIYVSYNVPEPATIALLGIGAMALRRKIKK